MMPTMMASIVDDEDAKAKATNSTMATTTEENDEDTVILGSIMNACIADAVADRIHFASPLASHEPLVTTIEQSYMRIVNVIEAYGRQNILQLLSIHHDIDNGFYYKPLCNKTTTTKTRNMQEQEVSSNKKRKKKIPESFEHPSEEQIPSPRPFRMVDATLDNLAAVRILLQK
jgi:hypothetical protein